MKNLGNKLYSLTVSNPTDSVKECTLFGSNSNLLSVNFGSDVNIKVVPTLVNASYLQVLQQSAHVPSQVNLIRIKSKNKKQLHRTIQHNTTNGIVDETRKMTTYSCDIIKEKGTKLYYIDIYVNIKVDGNTMFKLFVDKKTEFTIELHGFLLDDFDKHTNKSFIKVLFSIISCQLQQGKDFVKAEEIFKMIKDVNQEEVWSHLTRLVSMNYVTIDYEKGYGVKLDFMKYDGTIDKILLTSMIKKSEISL